MPSPLPASRPRIDALDAMRGSALLGILLVHAMEHWSLPRYPQDTPAWLQALDVRTMDLGLFLFEGKAYAIFSLLFGLSFFLILDRWSARGLRFRTRFLWRLVLLAGIGYLHGIIYCGDILLTIAVLGLPLVFLYRRSDRALGWIAAALLMQVPIVWDTARLLLDPAFQPWRPQPWVDGGSAFAVYAEGSFGDVTAINLRDGQVARLWWAFESGRYLQMSGLFVFGLLLGRSRLFEDPMRCRRLARRVLIWGLAGFAVLYAAKFRLADRGIAVAVRSQAGNLLAYYRSLAQAAVWISAFVLLWQWTRARGALRLLAPYGRLSLTCYVMQGLVGVPLFYGYGLALHRQLGPFASALVGGAIFVAQCAGANLWLRHFHYGPLEWLWRSATFLDFSTPLRRAQAAVDLDSPDPAALPSSRQPRADGSVHGRPGGRPGHDGRERTADR